MIGIIMGGNLVEEGGGVSVPVLSSPTFSGGDPYNIGVDTDSDSGTIYWFVRSVGGFPLPPPVAADIKSNAHHTTAVSSSGTVTDTMTSRGTGTKDLFVVHENAAGDSNLVSKRSTIT